MSAGWINYVYPGARFQNVSNEFYGGLAHASYFNPAARVYVDVHSGTGIYLNLSASHTYAIGSPGLRRDAKLRDRLQPQIVDRRVDLERRRTSA